MAVPRLQSEQDAHGASDLPARQDESHEPVPVSASGTQYLRLHRPPARARGGCCHYSFDCASSWYPRPIAGGHPEWSPTAWFGLPMWTPLACVQRCGCAAAAVTRRQQRVCRVDASAKLRPRAAASARQPSWRGSRVCVAGGGAQRPGEPPQSDSGGQCAGSHRPLFDDRHGLRFIMNPNRNLSDCKRPDWKWGLSYR